MSELQSKEAVIPTKYDGSPITPIFKEENGRQYYTCPLCGEEDFDKNGFIVHVTKYCPVEWEPD